MCHILSVSELLTIQANENSTLQNYRNFYFAIFSIVLFVSTIQNMNSSRLLLLLFAVPFVGMMLLQYIQENRVTVVEYYCKSGGVSIDEYYNEIRSIKIKMPSKYVDGKIHLLGARGIFTLLRWIALGAYILILILSFI
jgi:hypothetical protein